MPQVFKIGSYLVYFWANEGKPTEPVYVHASKRKALCKCNKVLDNTNREVPDGK